MTNRSSNGGNSAPISLHPENPRYFLFRGKPEILITSGEHYGAVLNLDFDYETYLNELHSHGLNHTRLFAGTYREIPGFSGIKGNTLAPEPGKYICPWAQSNEASDPANHVKYDLTKWDDKFFERLKDFCRKASDRGIVIELVLFCPHYNDRQWDISPMNIKNNINGVGNVPRNEVFTMKHRDLLEVQTAFTKKIVAELNSFDNLFFEICNEPWVDEVEEEWQFHIAGTIVSTEATLPFKHLISQDICNGRRVIKNPHKDISIFNFHYASPPDAVTLNYDLGKVIGLNETGFAGVSDYTYRYQAWEFIMAGGGLYNNLDYSFSAGYEDGTFKYPDTQPGGGSKELRKQLGILKKFIDSFDFIHMKPCNEIIERMHVSNGTGYMLGEHGKAYAMYIRAFAEGMFDLDIPAGRYGIEWINPKNGVVEEAREIVHDGGVLELYAPPYKEDIALKILRI